LANSKVLKKHVNEDPKDALLKQYDTDNNVIAKNLSLTEGDINSKELKNNSTWTNVLSSYLNQIDDKDNKKPQTFSTNKLSTEDNLLLSNNENNHIKVSSVFGEEKTETSVKIIEKKVQLMSLKQNYIPKTNFNLSSLNCPNENHFNNYKINSPKDYSKVYLLNYYIG